MKHFTSVSLLLLWYFLNLSDTKMILKSIKQCEDKDYPISYNITIHFENEDQFMDANSTLKIPLSNDLKGMFQVDLILGNKKIKVLSITERKACDSLHKHFGEFIYGIERASGLTPGLCPISSGRYRLVHHLLNFNKMTIRDFPFGILHFTMAFLNKRDEAVCCLEGELDN